MKLKPIKLKKDKKAQSQFNLFSLMVMAFLVVVLFGGLMYTMSKINTVMHEVGVINDQSGHPTYSYPCVNDNTQTCNGTFYANMTKASDSIFGQMNISIQALKMVAIVYILGMAVSIIITNAMMKINPVWFFAYVLIALLAVLFAPTISNAYETLLQSGIYDGMLNQFSASNYLLANLPTFVMVVGLIGGMFLFINFIRGNGEGNLQ